jgi:hypothetical protein
MRGAVRLLVVVSLLSGAACTTPGRWVASPDPTLDDARALMCAEDMAALQREARASELPRIPPPKRMRPCCVLGADVRVRVGPVPIPGFRVANVIGVDDIGPHTYDSGLLHVGRKGDEPLAFNQELNGIVYTCRGGFIDTAHVRGYVDWALYLTATVGRYLLEGGNIELPEEGGVRRVLVKPVPQAVLDRVGGHRFGVGLGQWLAFQLSIWHEIVTWHGWHALPGWPERVSAFSPEDLYSNLLGAKIIGGVALLRSGRSEDDYNYSVDAWLSAMLRQLGAVPRRAGREAIRAVDGLWWDSSRRLPDPAFVRRRYFDTTGPLEPWLVTDVVGPERLGDRLRARCGAAPEPVQLSNPDSLLGVPFRQWATLEITVSEELVKQPLFMERARRITQDDFPGIVEQIRRQSRKEFGPRADRPD